jgi:hypothetical protein
VGVAHLPEFVIQDGDGAVESPAGVERGLGEDVACPMQVMSLESLPVVKDTVDYSDAGTTLKTFQKLEAAVALMVREILEKSVPKERYHRASAIKAQAVECLATVILAIAVLTKYLGSLFFVKRRSVAEPIQLAQ